MMLEQIKRVPNLKPELKNSLIPVLFVLLWSSGAIFVELGLHDSTPFAFVSLRFVLSMLIMWLICLLIKSPIPKSFAEWRNILITGLFLQAGYQVFFFLALAYEVSPGILSIILGAQPILTTIATRQKTSFGKWAGLILGIAGLVLVVGDSIFAGTLSVLGISSTLLSLAFITAGTILQKRVTVSMPTNLAIQYTGGSVVLLLLTPIFESSSVNWTITFWIALAWMVLVISIGASMLLFYLIRIGNLTNVTSLLYCVPPVTALLDYFIFGHTLSIIAILGMLLIIAGLILINRKGLT
ncbi:EamA family transporter [Bacillus canaveralius]|uniref:EamA family transporter n=1 Tax=Bacillus canaveralius TaxID=1403243 RepID=A0A2N5GP99_9BACI|nr:MULTISPECIES: DMT family transporter [Bacillus]PLR84397.1 EamA family transporter [Bacillus canaveralius]PLR87019.1 EamA family transporter [Bacillus sp. V33-4]PLS00601.1 EamA family transporter [Bacillus canaveralius]